MKENKSLHSICRWTFNAGKGGFVPDDMRPEWNYKNLSYSTKKSDDGKTLTLWELSTGDSTEVSKHYNLLITFNQNDVVKDFELVLAPFDSK